MYSSRRFSVACLSVLFILPLALCQRLLENPTKGSNEKTKYTKIFGKSAVRRLIENAGYGYENYSVTTEDGYILNLNRIVNPMLENENRGYPLLLLNGYLMHSEAWLVQERQDTNIAAVWAGLGYDVWLGDQRGTIRSRRHVNLTTEDMKYWDFTFHESGLYDMAAFVDFILEKTGHNDLIFSCISLGCSFHAILISQKPSYNEKIRGAIYFAPLLDNIRKMSTMTSLMQLWFKMQINFMNLLEKNGIENMFVNFGGVKKELYHLCRPTSSLSILGARILFGKALHSTPESMCSMVFLSMGGTNVRSTKHVLQVYDRGEFAQYDYGREENLRRYGTELPPLYDVSKITSFVAIYYSDSDTLISPEGTLKTMKTLSGPTYGCKLPYFNHVDVATGWTFRYVFPDVIEVLNAMSGYKNNTEKLRSGKCPPMDWIKRLN